MLKFQEESLRQSVNGALALRHQINQFLDAIFEKGITNVCFLGIGGTYASAMQDSFSYERIYVNGSIRRKCS